MCNAEAESLSLLQVARERLITKDDPLHVHKTLGLLALCSFVFRFSQIGSGDMGFRTYPSLTIPTIFIHLCLNLSSFEFHLPKKRISYGGRIWPQARLHSAIFVGRSLLLMFLYWYEEKRHLSPNYTANTVIVLVTMALADGTDRLVGKYKSNTVRDLSAPPSYRYFYSLMQFYATARMLFGLRRYSVPFATVCLIQVGSFSATLRRKNLMPHKNNVFNYVLALCFVSAVTTLEHFWMAPDSSVRPHGVVLLLGNCAALLRMGPDFMASPSSGKARFSSLGLRLWSFRHAVLRNKYVIWSLLSLLLSRVIRPILEEQDDVDDKTTSIGFWMPSRKRQLQWLALLSIVPVLVRGHSKCSAEAAAAAMEDGLVDTRKNGNETKQKTG